MWFDIDGNPIDVALANELLGDLDARRIAVDNVGPYEISTVHLVLDHQLALSDEPGPPLIFETMVFGSRSDQFDGAMWRTATKFAALAQHDQTVALIREHLQVSTGEHT